jgi:serine/threonine protein kinase
VAQSTFVGSAAYAAPEILANEQYVGPATDVWSLGVIMYTLLVGKQPFDHSGNQATFFLKVQAAEFEMPDFISPGIFYSFLLYIVLASVHMY